MDAHADARVEQLSPEALTEAARRALEGFPSVQFALLFGSAAIGALREDSDVDVAVYVESGGLLDVEADREIEEEPRIQLALERATQQNVDLLVLNRAPSTVCAAAVLAGRPVLVRDGSLYRRFYLAVTDVASRFLETEREYREIRRRSGSLSDLDRSRLERILDFIEEELQDQRRLSAITQGHYRQDRDARRSLDRWVETLISAAIDTAKIVLASQQRPVPQTCGPILADLEVLPGFSPLAGRLSPLAALRNLMAQEYLDVRFSRVKRFAATDWAAVADLARAAREWLSRP